MLDRVAGSSWHYRDISQVIVDFLNGDPDRPMGAPHGKLAGATQMTIGFKAYKNSRLWN